MQPLFVLPKKSDDRMDALKSLSRAAEPSLTSQIPRWQISKAYLEGVRDFISVDYSTGTIQVAYRDTAGQLGFKYEEVLLKLAREVGRFLQIDFGPKAMPRGRGIESLRSASVAQAYLDYMTPETKLLSIKLNALIQFLLYGTIGIGAWVAPGAKVEDKRLAISQVLRQFGETDNPPASRTLPPMPSMEVIPPWELLPIPHDPATMSDVIGLIRRRWIAYDWLKGQSYLQLPRDTTKLNLLEVPVGVVPGGPSDASTLTSGEGGHAFSQYGGTQQSKTPTIRYAPVEEFWLFDARRDVGDYLFKIGDAEVGRRDYSQVDDPPPSPIGVASNNLSGGFYGRGWIEPMISVNDEIEGMIGSLVENVEDLDNYGYVVISTTSGISRDQIDAGGKPKILWAEPDYVATDTKPVYNVGPVNAGTLPGQVAELGLKLLDRLSGQSEIMGGDAPGRVDNYKALDFLFESSNVPLGAPASALALGFSQCYRAMLRAAKETWTPGHSIRITALDNSLAGIVINPETQNVEIDKNPVPSDSELDIGVKARYPESKARLAQELKEALAGQIIQPWEYRVEVRKRGLDLPVGNEQEWQSYQQAVLENLLLFGDGQSPGGIDVADHDLVSIHKAVLLAFMSSPLFRIASSAVRSAFERHLDLHKAQEGIYPQALPYPEEIPEDQDNIESTMQAMQNGGIDINSMMPGGTGGGPVPAGYGG